MKSRDRRKKAKIQVRNCKTKRSYRVPELKTLLGIWVGHAKKGNYQITTVSKRPIIQGQTHISNKRFDSLEQLAGALRSS